MDQWLLNYVLDWFLKQGQLKTCHDYDDYYGDDDKFVEWQDGCKERMTQKAQTKEELIPIAWHLDCVMDWCMSEDEKGRWK